MERKFEVSLDEIIKVFLTIEKLQQFFRQPDHYPDIKAIQDFLGM